MSLRARVRNEQRRKKEKWKKNELTVRKRYSRQRRGNNENVFSDLECDGRTADFSFSSITARPDALINSCNGVENGTTVAHATSCAESVICATMRVAPRTRLASTNYYPHEIRLFLPVLNATSSAYSRTELHGLKITGEGGEGGGGGSWERRINRHHRRNNPVAK